MAYQEKSKADPLVIKLPHPYLTSYEVRKSVSNNQPARFQILPSKAFSTRQGFPLPTPLHDEALTFTEVAYLADDVVPQTGDNSSWARARRSPHVTISWSTERPSVAKVWLIAYTLISLHPLFEQVRILFSGRDSDLLARELYATGLFHPHPKASAVPAPHDGHLLLRGAFWQGAGSPFGPRPVWAPRLDAAGKPITTEYPPFPFQIAPNTQFPALQRHTMHPVREPKPEPGSIIYSRWIPHLKEHFTMVAIDYTNSAHLDLFHTWQNDPRVAAAWKETGTLEEHREYLRKMHEDPHVLTMFAAFDDVLFAYFEVYWAMESNMGAFYRSSPYDRGRHSLVGDVQFRGPHRVSAWWSSLAHYCFLDEPRTWRLVGEPSITGDAVFAYDFAHGFYIEKLMDFSHKRSALQMVNREKFFTLSPFVWDGEKKVRPSLDALARL